MKIYKLACKHKYFLYIHTQQEHYVVHTTLPNSLGCKQ